MRFPPIHFIGDHLAADPTEVIEIQGQDRVVGISRTAGVLTVRVKRYGHPVQELKLSEAAFHMLFMATYEMAYCIDTGGELYDVLRVTPGFYDGDWMRPGNGLMPNA